VIKYSNEMSAYGLILTLFWFPQKTKFILALNTQLKITNQFSKTNFRKKNKIKDYLVIQVQP